jgi:hemolysin activation/secretion protein
MPFEKTKKRLPLVAALTLVFPAFAQQAPDAGQSLQQLTPPALTPPRSSPGVAVEPPAEDKAAPGGPTVTLKAVRFVGNTVFTEAELAAVLGEVTGRRYDLAGLRALAGKITDHYRTHGYPFARALIPAQGLADGVLTLQIVEGRYARVQAQGAMADAAQGFLADLRPGEVIEAASLERATLILSDQPGVKVAPLIRPGQEVGTGDLVVEVAREPLVKGELGLDNHGNRYTGQTRLKANVQADSPFMLGDQFLGRLLYTDEGLWLASLGYSLPVGTSGLRGNVGYAHTYYELGKDFKNLGAHGTAKVTSAGLSYPILRSQKANLALAVSYQHKALEDRQDAVSTRNDKSSDTFPIVLQFDRRDGTGITYGALAYTAGRLKLDAALEAADIVSRTNTRGHFDKWNLDLARLQTTPISNLTLFGRFSGQWAGKNLDSSESFILGGASGVRAYPQGEGAGDEGYFVQLEARLRLGSAEPFAFYDAGSIRINADPGPIVPPVANNTRSLAGAGLGVRYGSGPWSLEATLAWRTHGGAPTADTEDQHPRAWLAAGYRF